MKKVMYVAIAKGEVFGGACSSKKLAMGDIWEGDELGQYELVKVITPKPKKESK